MDNSQEHGDLIKFYKGRFKQLDAMHSPWTNLWQQIQNYVVPHRGDFTATSHTGGEKRTQKIFDPTAPWAHNIFTAGMVGFNTSPVETFFALETLDRELNALPEVRQHMDIVVDVMFLLGFASPSSNFASQNNLLHSDLGSFGVAAMQVEDIPIEPINFTTWHINDCRIMENKFGVVDTLYRRVRKVNQELLRDHGEKFSESQRDKLSKKPFEKTECQFAVEPAKNVPEKFRKNPKKFAACLFIPEFDVILEQGGYDRFPYAVPRWQKTTGEIYGRSPAMMALPSIKLVNKMMETILRSGQQRTLPAWQMPDDSFLTPLKVSPNAVNYYRSGTNDRIEPLPSGGDPGFGVDILQLIRSDIQRAFYVDILEMPEKNNVEVKEIEILQQQESKMRKVAPLTGPIQSEYMTPIVRLVYEAFKKRGLFPPVPDVLKEQPFRVKYVSPVVRAQRSTQLGAANRWLELVIQLAQAKPEVLDKVNADGWVEWSHELLGASSRIVNSEEQVEAVREGRQQQEQLTQQASVVKELGAGVKDFAAAQQLSQESDATQQVIGQI